MSPATAVIDAEAAVVAAACEWCGDPLSSPYLRRTDGTGLHVACAKNFARATAQTTPA
ncbi:MAG TPA: hypothetical protein VF228_13260 [Iamia sp.]